MAPAAGRCAYRLATGMCRSLLGMLLRRLGHPTNHGRVKPSQHSTISKLAVALAFSVIAMSTAVPAVQGASGDARTTSQVRLGAYIPDSLWTIDGLKAYRQKVGRRPAFVMDMLNWETRTVETRRLDAIIDRGSRPIISWVPAIGSSLNQPEFRMRAIADGAHDAWIRPWAHELAVWGKKVHIRFAYEMNGDWAPWCVGVNGNTSADFVDAWRHVVDVFRQEGATNVKWIWSPNVEVPGQTTPFADVYPGDAYVDWIALDGYNWGTSRGWGQWRSFSSIFGSSYAAVTALSSRPLMIARPHPPKWAARSGLESQCVPQANPEQISARSSCALVEQIQRNRLAHQLKQVVAARLQRSGRLATIPLSVETARSGVAGA